MGVANGKVWLCLGRLFQPKHSWTLPGSSFATGVGADGEPDRQSAEARVYWRPEG